MTVSIKNRSAFLRFGKILVFTAAILGTTKLTLEFASLTSASTAAFSFLIIVLLSAFFGDLLVAIAISVVATLCFDYFYLPPLGTFHIDAFSDWISLAAFLLASVIISRLTASASENVAKVRALDLALTELREFGEWLSSMPNSQLTLSGTAQEALRVFSLEYCSIHVYGEGKWRHLTGSSTVEVSPEIEPRLKYFQDHPADLIDLAEESLLGVRYMRINKGTTPVAVMAVKSNTLPAEALEALACLVGVRLSTVGELV